MPTTRTKAPRRTSSAPSTSALGRIELLLEDMRHQNAMTLEAVLAMDAKFERKIEELRQELLARIEVLESVVRQNSADIQELKAAVHQNTLDIRKNSEDIRKNSEDIRKNSEDIQALRAEIAEIKTSLPCKADEAELRKLEVRVQAIERSVL